MIKLDDEQDIDYEIENVIENCMWRKDMYGISICKGELAPCIKVIDAGKCDTLKEYFKEKRNGDRDKTGTK